MLTTILNNLPVPKCVIIEDSLVLQGNNILLSIIKAHWDLKKEIHYFAFASNPEKIETKFGGDKFHVHDYLTDSEGWIEASNKNNFAEYIEKNKINGIIVIDSLAHFIFEYGLSQAYKILHNLANQKGIFQVVTLLHTDMLENKKETLKYFEHLSTLYLKLNLIGNSTRVEYRQRKSGGKLIKKVEEYFFENNLFLTKALEKVDATKLLGPAAPEKLPENMSTFKISLDENEKKSREELTLPYTVKSNIDQPGQGGNIIYNLDDEDDWDDEDPDDDLDI